jgi:hypothetical protein
MTEFSRTDRMPIGRHARAEKLRELAEMYRGQAMGLEQMGFVLTAQTARDMAEKCESLAALRAAETGEAADG